MRHIELRFQNSGHACAAAIGGAGDSFPGGHSGREPPDPFPKSEVKTLCADGSLAVGQVRVGHCQDPMRSPRRKRRGLFFVQAAGMDSFPVGFSMSGAFAACFRALIFGAGVAVPALAAELPARFAETPLLAVEDTYPHVSHDGHVVFQSTRLGAAKLFVAKLDGSNLRQLTQGESVDVTPKWSFD